MAITVKERTSPQVPPGTHIAVCYRIVDIGTQPDTGFGQKEKIVIFWELPHERITVDGKEMPIGMSKIYAKTIGKRSTLRKDLESWRGRAFSADELASFDLAAILGKPCQLQIAANDEGKSNVVAVVGVPKGTQVPPAFNPLVEWSVANGKDDAYAKLPEWVRKMADSCIEWNPQAATSAKVAPGHEAPPVDDGDEVPF